MRLMLITVVCGLIAHGTQAQQYGTWETPFTKTSIWNTPIGSGAVYVDARIDEAFHRHYDSNEAACDRVTTEAVVLYRERSHYPKTEIYASSWGNRCDPQTKLEHSIRFPPEFLYNSTPRTGSVEANGAWAFMWADGTLRAATIFGRCRKGGPLLLPSWAFNRSTRVDGDGLIDASGHGASGMSGLGGLLRIGELSSDEPIPHPLKLTWPAWAYAYFGDDRRGFRWPARLADNYANRQDRYLGDRPELVMGSLLALPPNVAVPALSLTPIGKKLATTMQHYGVYLVEDCGPGPDENWERWQLMIELDVGTGRSPLDEANALGYQFLAGKGEDGDFKNDMNVLLPLLHIVDNNRPDSIGGGGTPLMDLPDSAPRLRD
ncbi:MAG: hypothetical protein AAGJ40_19820 [Planctomycetota bacterium]